MNEMQKTIIEVDTTPDESLMSKIGKFNAKPEEAIADLVDNSLDARILDKPVTVKIVIDDGFISIEDDGLGMTQYQTGKSAKLAYSEKGPGDQGEFGMGLQNASSSLGILLELWTTQAGSVFEYSYKTNFSEKSGYKLEVHRDPKAGEVFLKKSGTRLKISQLHMKLTGQKIAAIRKHLEKVYAIYLLNKEIRIVINGVVCVADDPVLKTNYDLVPTGNFVPDNTGKHHFELSLESGAIIHGWVGLKEKGKGDFGINLFSNNRLIKPYAKIGFSEHPSNRQIIGWVHINHVQRSVSKKTFEEGSPEYEELKKEGGNFWEFMRPLVNEAHQNVKRVRNNKINDAIDNHAARIADMLDNLEELDGYQIRKKSGFRNGRRIVGDLEPETTTKEKRDTSKTPKPNLPIKDKGTKRNRTPKKVQSVISLNSARSWLTIHWTETSDPSTPYEMVENENGLHVQVNMPYKGWDIDEANWEDEAQRGFSDFCTAESAAKYYVGSKEYPDPSEVEKVRNIIWQTISKLGLPKPIIKTKKGRAA